MDREETFLTRDEKWINWCVNSHRLNDFKFICPREEEGSVDGQLVSACGGVQIGRKMAPKCLFGSYSKATPALAEMQISSRVCSTLFGLRCHFADMVNTWGRLRWTANSIDRRSGRAGPGRSRERIGSGQKGESACIHSLI